MPSQAAKQSMKSFLIAYAAITGCCFLFAVLSPDYAFLIIIGWFLISLVAVPAGFAFITITDTSKTLSQKNPATGWEAIDIRWPRNRFPRFDDLGENFEGKTEDKEFFEKLLRFFPAPPRTESERKANEREIFSTWAEIYSVVEDGKPMLKPRQEVIDDYAENEIHLLRAYYAATGIYRPAFYGPEYARIVRTFNEGKHKMAINAFGGTHSEAHAEAKKQMQKAREEMAKYSSEANLNKHMQENGGWFYVQLELALQGEIQDFGPASATSAPDHPAGDDLEYKPTA